MAVGSSPYCRRAQCITILSTVPKYIPLDLSTFGFGYDARTGEVHVCFGHNVLLVMWSLVQFRWVDGIDAVRRIQTWTASNFKPRHHDQAPPTRLFPSLASFQHHFPQRPI